MIELLRRALDEDATAEALAADLCRHAICEDVDELSAVLERFLRTLPDAIGYALALSKDPRCGRSVAFATGPVLHYLFDDEDLLPEATFGTLGLLDDAYLVHSFAALLRQAYPLTDPAGLGYPAPDARSFELVAALLPDGVAQALRRTCESTIQVAQALMPAAGAEGADAAPAAPQLRIEEALRATADSVAAT